MSKANNLSSNDFLTSKAQLWMLIISCLVLYVNTLSNQYALDDSMVLTENKYVKKGVSGIKDLLTKDSFYGYIGEAGKLTGGRWRPLSLIVFALEYKTFGKKPFIYHLNNLALYILCCTTLLFFLRKYVFKENQLAAFFSTFIFAIHPIHTEVVANIKSLDEILSLLLLLTTLYYSLQYINEGRERKYLIISLCAYFLALLSKENGITFLAIIPLSFYFFSKENIKGILFCFLPYLIVGLLYLSIRFIAFRGGGESIDIVNAPFLYANSEEKIATKIFILGKYLFLLFFPHPLTYDYSFKQIPYVNLTNIYVWLTFLIYTGMSFFALLKLKQRSIFSFFILFYIISISIVSNFVVDIGAPMGERFLFQPSIGFAVCAGIIFSELYSIPKRKFIFITAIGIIVILSVCVVIPRNKDWENNDTLFLNDVHISSNSVRTNFSAGAQLIIISEKQDEAKKIILLKEAIPYLERAIQIDSETVHPYLNLGIIYQRLGNLNKAEEYWNKARILKPNSSNLKEYDLYLASLYMKKGLKEVNVKQNFKGAIFYFNKSIKYKSDNADAWCNLGAAYFAIGNYKEAKSNFERALAIDSTHKLAKEGIKGATEMMK